MPFFSKHGATYLIDIGFVCLVFIYFILLGCFKPQLSLNGTHILLGHSHKANNALFVSLLKNVHAFVQCEVCALFRWLIKPLSQYFLFSLLKKMARPCSYEPARLFFVLI